MMPHPHQTDGSQSTHHHRVEANEEGSVQYDDDGQRHHPTRGGSISTEMLDVGGNSNGDSAGGTPPNVVMPREPTTKKSADGNYHGNSTTPYPPLADGSGANNKRSASNNNVSMSPDAVGFFTQYFATLRRQLLQKSRMPVGWAIEIVIPIIFVVGIILISLAVTIEEKDGEQFITDDNTVTDISSSIRASMCYANATTTSPGIQALLSLCSFTRDTIPDTALCMPDNVLSLINITARDVCVSNLSIPTGFSKSTGFKQQMSILDFDDMVLLQLMYRVVFGGPPVSLFTTDSVTASLRTSGALYFTPKTDLVERVLDTMRSKYQLLDLVYSGTYNSRDEITSTLEEGKTWGIIDIQQPGGEEKSADVVIALNRSALPQSSDLRPQYETGGLEAVSYSQYWGSGFLTLQSVVFEILLNNGTVNATTSAITPVIGKTTLTALVPMGYADYKENAFLIIAGSLAPLMLVLAFLYPVSQVAKRFVEEKELRLREGTMIMGLGKGAFFCSWLTIYHAQMILLSVIIAILLKASVMTGSDWFLIFFTFSLFGIATVHLAALLATCFSSSKVTALVVPLLYFAMAIPSFAIPSGSADGIYPIISLLCPVPFSVGLQLLFGYEINDGMGWGNIGSATDTPMNMGGVLGYFILDILLYTVLMIYFDLVIPKQWGTTYHPCFCFCCCCGKCCVDKDEDDEIEFGDNTSEHGDEGSNKKIPRPWLSRTSHLVQRQLETNRTNGGSSSPKSTRQATSDMTIDTVQEYPLPIDQATVHIKRMRKVFDAPSGVKKKNVAVNKFDLRLYPNTITALLGHNGAGKTTVMNMITGMLNITTGDVVVYGDSVTKDLQKVRRKVGYCPQHNILWDDLTCIEHLEYFGRLKGMSGAALTEEVEHLLKEVDLWEKAKNRSHELSGGQKRKLSVAIAFMGGANLILLDEPTAGMDVGARRHTWELLKEMSSKNNRTVLLTTHFMDEADLLGSRIAIMSKGEMEAYGTSTFLKNKLGTGYVMKIASSEPFKNPEQVLTEVKRTIPPAELKECKGLEMTLALPKTHIREFAGVIRKLESEEMRLAFKISTISMSVSTLEDVFVQMALDEELRGAEADRAAALASDGEDDDAKAIKVDEGNKNWLPVLEKCYTKQLERAQRITDGGQAEQSASGAFMRQLGGLFMKRVNHAKRDYRTLFLQIVLPIIVIIIAMGLGEIPIPSSSRLQLNGELYSKGEDQLIQLNGCEQPIVDALPGYQQVTTSDLPTLNYSLDLQSTAKSHGGVERMAGASCNKPGVVRSFDNSVVDGGANFTSLFVNGSAYHIAPILLNQLYAASARYITGNADLPVNIATYALPRTSRQEAIIEGISGVVVTIFILIPFTFIPSTYVGYAVKEKETKSKHLQFVSGVHYLAYWLANFMFDFLCFLVTMAIALIIFAMFGRDEFVGGPSNVFGATFVLLLFYGISGITSAYAISFLFDNSSTAQNMVMFGNFIAGFMLVLVVYILGAVSESGKSITDVIAWIFRLIPAYCLGEGLIQLSASKSSFEINGVRKDPFGTEVVAYDLLFMGIMAVGYFILVLAIDNPSTPATLRKLLPCIRGDDAFDTAAADIPPANATDGRRGSTSQPGDDDMSVRDSGDLNDEELRLIEEGEDEDVSRERQQIRSGARADDAVRVNRLRKVYPNGKVAVRSLTFGVKKGEVFGFLGTNGAGKTTTMSMLTGEFAPTSGGGMIGPYNVVDNARDAQRIIGYCPQFDAVMELMTPFEHLTLYAALRLVPVGSETDDLIGALMAACDLLKYRDIPSGNLSGGNRRKLSIAIALIGGPQVVFLDEPSAGIDPAARRQLFDAITFVATHSAVVLTTHHLEEVDVLAHRVGIMDRGALKCLGSLESLKAKYGDGIEVTLQATTDVGVGAPSVEENVMKAKKFMQSTFPEATISEERQQRLLYVLPFSSIKLSDLFEKIMEAVDSGEHGIQDYTVQQSSLEQVFLRISRQGEEDAEQEEAEEGKKSRTSIAAPPPSRPIAELFKEDEDDEECEKSKEAGEELKEVVGGDPGSEDDLSLSLGGSISLDNSDL